MLLRSGKVKELIAKCYKCNEFYGNKRYKYKCSGCHGTVKSSYPWRDEEFRNRVNEWAQEKIRITKTSGGFRTLKQSELLFSLLVDNIPRDLLRFLIPIPVYLFLKNLNILRPIFLNFLESLYIQFQSLQ